MNQPTLNNEPEKPEEQTSKDNPEKVGLQVAIVTAVVILVLFGLYWGGKLLLMPDETKDKDKKESKEVAIDTPCDNPKVYTNINNALSNANNVCKMDLSGKNLKKLSAYIGNFRNLRELDISNNQLTNLPPHIGWLRKLKKFDASNNQLTGVPVHVGWLRELEEWDLSNNQIQKLPVHVGWIREIRTLNLANNQLTNLPIEMGWMSKMKVLNLSGNPAEVKPSAKRLRPYMRGAKMILP